MDNEEDMKLYNKYLNGEKEAFNILYLKYKNKIQYFIFNIVKDYQKSEDIMQDVFIYILNNKFKENCSFKYYIYLIAKSRAVSYINIENRRKEIINTYLLTEKNEIEKDELDILIDKENKSVLIESINQLKQFHKLEFLKLNTNSNLCCSNKLL